MPEIVLTSGQRTEWNSVEIDFTGNSVFGLENYQVRKKYPFFHVAKVVYDEGLVFIEDYYAVAGSTAGNYASTDGELKGCMVKDPETGGYDLTPIGEKAFEVPWGSVSS